MALLFVVIAATQVALPVRVDTIDGRTVQGTITTWNNEALIVESDGGPQRLLPSNLLAIRLKAAEGPVETPAETPEGNNAADRTAAGWIRLVDDSRLPVKQVTVQSGQVRVTTLDGENLKWPVALLASVGFGPDDHPVGLQAESSLGHPRVADVLVIRRKDRIDYVEGVIEEVSQDSVRFRVEHEALSIPRTKLAGLIYYRAKAAELPEAMCRVIGSDGMDVAVQQVALEGDHFALTGLSGAKWSVPCRWIERFDLSAGKVVYLSDLQPESVEWLPFVDFPSAAARVRAFGAPRRDQAIGGGPLRVGGQSFEKGLALRSRTELVYRTGGSFREFAALAGMDDRTGGRGHVQMTIVGDGRTLWDEAISGSDPPRRLSVDIRGVQLLTLRVDYGEGLDLSDHLDLCDARLLK